MFSFLTSDKVSQENAEKGIFIKAKDEFKKYELNNDVEDINAVYELGESTYVNADKDEPYITVYSTIADFVIYGYTLTIQVYVKAGVWKYKTIMTETDCVEF